jgi:Protein of unknown function (DUF3987)
MPPDAAGPERLRDFVRGTKEIKPEPPRPLMRELPPADPFPVDALGDLLGPAARAIHCRVQAPLAICGQSLLAAATLAVQPHVDVELPTKQARPISNYYMTVAATGERKTTVDYEALYPIRRREAELHKIYDANRAGYANRKLAWEEARRAAAKANKNDRLQIETALDVIGPEPPPPLIPLLTCPEPTYEGMCGLLQNGLPSLGIFASEGGQFIGGHGMSDDAKLRTAAGLSAAWDGEPIKRVRRGDGVMILPGRRVSMHLMAQPDVASAMLTDRLLTDQGILSRILASAPDAASGTRTWRELQAEAALTRYGTRLKNILELPLPLADGTQNTLAPRTLPLSVDARRLWIGFYDHVERLVAAGRELEPVRALANKLPEHAARMAAVLTLVCDINAAEIAAAEMRAGIGLAQHYAAEALRLSAASRIRADLRLACLLLDWLRHDYADRAVSLPDIYQRGPGAIRDKTNATRIVAILEDHGWVVRIDGGAEIDGHWRRGAWRLVSEA